MQVHSTWFDLLLMATILANVGTMMSDHYGESKVRCMMCLRPPSSTPPLFQAMMDIFFCTALATSVD